MYPLAIVAALIMTLILVGFNMKKTRGSLYIVVVHYRDEEAYDQIRQVMGTMKYRIKSRTVRGNTNEMAMEVYLSNKNMVFVEKLKGIDEVEDVTTIQYDGEYHA